MFRRSLLWIALTCLFCIQLAKAQQLQYKSAFVQPDTTFNKLKFGLVSGGILTTYGTALIGLNYVWYKGFERSRFQFFNDGKEWLGMDKAGHVMNAYYQSRWAIQMFRWTGIEDKKAIWIGGMTGTFLQSSIEVLDAFSAKWGFSGYDFLANMGGSAIVIAQELAWKEQRIMIKISALPQDYPPELQQRTDNLYGTTIPELLLKDYNAITVWASVNVKSFMKRERRFPDWLNVAVGYGAGGLYGGFENKWCEGDSQTEYADCPDHLKVDRTDIRRYPQFYLSLDVDLTKIKTKSPFLKGLFGIVNVIKIPSPTVEFNPVDKVKFHPLFF